MTDIIDLFRKEYQDYERISQARQVESKNLLLQLQDHAGKPIHECDASDIRAFMAFLSEPEQEYEITTIAKKLAMLKPFFKWLWVSGRIEADAWLRISEISPPRGSKIPQLPRPYSKKELRRFRRELNERWPEVDEKWWKRWRSGRSRYRKIQPHAMRIQIEAIVALALYCGLRREEIYKISLDDVHYDNAYVVVREGKGGKFREVPHTASSRAAVKAWIELRTELAPDHDHLWMSLAWEQVATRPMSLERLGVLLTTIGKWELHRFRHTCATEWLRHIKRIEIVQKLLGHSKIQQTLVYAQLVNDDVLKAVLKAEIDFEEAVA
jgi:site-specific recombinase XerC